MEQTTIKSIREAETAAEQIEQDAAKTAKEMVLKAQSDASGQLERMVAQAKDRSAAYAESARQEGERLQQEALESVKQEIASLSAGVAGKKAAAQKLILAELI